MPTSIRWTVPTNLDADERSVAEALHHVGKFSVFLLTIRDELFGEAFHADWIERRRRRARRVGRAGG